jgi:hypothetical protein
MARGQHVIKNPSGWGQFGQGFGQGIAESFPKEVERARLSYGLNALADKKDLTPEKFLAEAYSIPGMSPEMVRQFGEFAKYKAQGKELGNVETRAKDFFEGQRESPKASPDIEKAAPTTTKPGLYQDVTKGFTRKTPEQEEQLAAKEYARRPAFHKNDPQNAINYVRNLEDENEKAYNRKKETLNTQLSANKQVIDSLQSQFDKLSGKDKTQGVVPADLYSRREDEALESIKPRDEGGKAYDPQQASKEFGEKLRKDDERYRKIKSVGSWWSAGGSNPGGAIAILKELSKQAAQEDDSKNFAKFLQASSGASPWLCNAIAYDINKSPTTNNTIKRIPDISKETFLDKKDLTLDASENILLSLAKEMKKKEDQENPPSLLAIGYYLRQKGYDPEIFKQYMLQNLDRLPNLKKWQTDELSETTQSYTPLTDVWLEQYK